MLRSAGTWTGDDPGLFGALLIALAGGWAASRLLRTSPDPFACLVLGVTGAVAGLSLAGAAGLRLGAIGLLAVSIGGGVGLFALCKAVSNVTEWRRNRNHVAPSEFESGGSTGRTQEDTYELDYRHHHRHRRRMDRREDHAPQPWSAHQPDRRSGWRPYR